MDKLGIGICLIALQSVFLTFFTAQVKAKGLPDTLCPSNPNSKMALTCETDCQHNHASVGGHCGDRLKNDFNCYCGEMTQNVYNKSLQCISLNDVYRNFCTVDCICNHAAQGGSCNWDLKACVCQGVGKNVENVHCPFTNSREFSNFSKESFESIGIKGFQGLNDQGDIYTYTPNGIIYNNEKSPPY